MSLLMRQFGLLPDININLAFEVMYLSYLVFTRQKIQYFYTYEHGNGIDRKMMT